MSNLNEMGLDADVEENSGSGGITLIPKGKYKAVIVADDVRSTKNNDGKGIELSMQIVEGKYADTILKDWINLKNKNPEAERIGQGILKRICKITGVPFPPPDTTLMFGKPFLLTVTVIPFYKDKTKNVNNINAYNPVPSDFVAETTTAPPPPTEQTDFSSTDDDW